MGVTELIVGAVVAASVFGAYVLGAFHGQRASNQRREFFGSMTRSLTPGGFIWCIALPICFLLLFYSFVAHVRISLGRWPEFGQSMDSWPFEFYDVATRIGAWALVSSLYVVPAVAIGCFFIRRWRHVSIYAAVYSAAVGLAIGSVFLAPDSFLNWYFD